MPAPVGIAALDRHGRAAGRLDALLRLRRGARRREPAALAAAAAGIAIIPSFVGRHADAGVEPRAAVNGLVQDVPMAAIRLDAGPGNRKLITASLGRWPKAHRHRYLRARPNVAWDEHAVAAKLPP